MKLRHVGVIVLLLAIGAASVSLYSGFTSRSRDIDLNPYQVLGTVVAEETAKLLGNQGQVLVIANDAKIASLEAELDALSQTLKKSAGVSVLPTDRVKLTPSMMAMLSGAVPPDELTRTVQSHPNLGAVVLFFSFPALADQDLDALKRSGVKFVVVSGYHPRYQGLLERQAIHLAIVPRPRSEAPPAATRKPGTLRERFDQEYLVLTPGAPAPSP